MKKEIAISTFNLRPPASPSPPLIHHRGSLVPSIGPPTRLFTLKHTLFGSFSCLSSVVSCLLSSLIFHISTSPFTSLLYFLHFISSPSCTPLAFCNRLHSSHAHTHSNALLLTFPPFHTIPWVQLNAAHSQHNKIDVDSPFPLTSLWLSSLTPCTYSTRPFSLTGPTTTSTTKARLNRYESIRHLWPCAPSMATAPIANLTKSNTSSKSYQSGSRNITTDNDNNRFVNNTNTQLRY